MMTETLRMVQHLIMCGLMLEGRNHPGVSAGRHKPGLVCTAIAIAAAPTHTHLRFTT